MFDYGRVLDVAIKRVDGQTVVDLTPRTAVPLPVLPALQCLLPRGLRRGSTVSVSGSISLVLALLGAGSGTGAWCALVGLPRISAESADEYGIDLRRLAVIPSQRVAQAGATGWSTAVGALLDSMDVVVACPPPHLIPGDVRRLAARARTRDAVLMPYLNVGAGEWPGADVRLSVRDTQWVGADGGSGRLTRRRITVEVAGRGQAARPRSAELWLPASGGGVQAVQPTAPIIPLRRDSRTDPANNTVPLSGQAS